MAIPLQRRSFSLLICSGPAPRSAHDHAGPARGEAGDRAHLARARHLAGRRWGSEAGGAVAGLPLTSAPLSLVLRSSRARASRRRRRGAPFGLVAVVGSLSLTSCLPRFPGGRGGGFRAGYAGLAAALDTLKPELPATILLLVSASSFSCGAWKRWISLRPGRRPGISGCGSSWGDCHQRFCRRSPAAGPALTGLLSTAPLFAASCSYSPTLPAGRMMPVRLRAGFCSARSLSLPSSSRSPSE